MKILTQWDSSKLESSSALKQCLADQPPELSDYHPPNESQLHSIIELRRRYLEHYINRQSLADALRESHLRRRAPASTLAAIERLREPDTYFIITGQQPGLLSGPLFTFYKILQVITLAAKYTQTGFGTFIPAFWNAAEDHDFSEISTLWWLGKDNQPVAFNWPGDPQSRTPYYLIPASACPVEEVLNFIKNHSHPTEFTEFYLDAIRSHWQQATTYPDFVDALIWSWFDQTGLLILRPDDEFFRRQSQSIIEAELDDPTRSSREINQVGQALQQFGLAAQIHKRIDRTAFFLIENNQRIPLYETADGFQDQAGTSYSLTEIQHRLKSEPMRFSPSAILRPIIQDALIPTIAAVLGPNELAYHYLLSPIYQRHAVPRPCLIPRMELTLFEPRIIKLLDKYKLNPLSLTKDVNALIKDILHKTEDTDVQLLRIGLDHAISAFFTGLKKQAQEIDPTFLAVLEKNRGKIIKEIETSEALLVRRKAEKNEVLRNQMLSLQSALFPGGEPQERRFNIFNYLIKYGPQFLSEMQQISPQIIANPHTFLQIS